MSDKKRVVISIYSGIPEIIEAPDGVDVEIWDYDTECYPEAELKQDEDGNKYFLREG